MTRNQPPLGLRPVAVRPSRLTPIRHPRPTRAPGPMLRTAVEPTEGLRRAPSGIWTVRVRSSGTQRASTTTGGVALRL